MNPCKDELWASPDWWWMYRLLLSSYCEQSPTDVCTGLLWYGLVSFRGQICSHRQDGSTEGHSEVLLGSDIFHLLARADASAGCLAAVLSSVIS